MSWFFDTILAGVSSFFSNGDGKKQEAEKKKKKRPVSEDDNGDADGASPATPPLRVTRHRRDSATKSALSVAVLQTMTPEARDAVCWEDAYAATGRLYLREDEKMSLVQCVSE